MRTGAQSGPVEGLLLRPPVEESVWLVEQRAAAVTKPGARRPCLVKNDRSWGRQIGQRLRKDPQHRSHCLDRNVESVM